MDHLRNWNALVGFNSHTRQGCIPRLPAGNLRHGRFLLTLNEDQLQIQKWVHDFAEDVIRPAAHEWDEREEFP